MDRVRVQYVAIGGAFGGREDMSIQIVLALAVMRLRERGILRPVRIIWSREESIIGHHKRHPAVITTKWGATKEGQLTAVAAELMFNSGAYAYTSTKVLGNAHLMITGPYVDPQRPRRQLRHYDQQRAWRRLPRLWRAAGRAGCGNANEPSGRSAGHGPD